MIAGNNLEDCVKLYVYSDGFYSGRRLKGLEPVFELVVCRDYIGFGNGGLVSPAVDEELSIDENALRDCIVAIKDTVRKYVEERETSRIGDRQGLPPSLNTEALKELLGLGFLGGCRRIGVDGLLLALTIALSPHVLSRDKLLVEALLEELGGSNV